MTEFKRISLGMSLDATASMKPKPQRTGRLKLESVDVSRKIVVKSDQGQKSSLSEEKIQSTSDTLTASKSQETGKPLLTTKAISPSARKWNKVIDVWKERYPDFGSAISEKFIEEKIQDLSQKFSSVAKSSSLLFKDKSLTHIVLADIGKGKFKAIQKVFDLEKSDFEALATTCHPQIAGEIEKEFEISRTLQELGVHGVVQYRELTTKDGQVGVLMELCDKGDLYRFIYDSDPQPDIEQIFALLLKAGETFAEMHTVGMVHRDIKLENIFVKSDQNVPTTRVGDLGLAVKSNKETDLVGTWEYIAPELLLGKDVVFGPKQDAWSFGAMLFGLLGGGGSLIGDELSERIRSDDIEVDTFFEQVKKSVQNVNWEERIEDEELRSAIKGLLHLDPEKRWTITEALPVLKRMSEI